MSVEGARPLSFPSVVVLSMAKASVNAFRIDFNVIATRKVAWMLILILAIGEHEHFCSARFENPRSECCLSHIRADLSALSFIAPPYPLRVQFCGQFLITQFPTFGTHFLRHALSVRDFLLILRKPPYLFVSPEKTRMVQLHKFFEMPFCWYRKRGTGETEK